METNITKEDKKNPMPNIAQSNKMRNAGEVFIEKMSGSNLEKQFDVLREKSKDYYSKTESVIKEHPFYAVMGAAALGYITGVIFNRKH